MFKYDLGIIGGMGSEATVEIYKRIINRTYHTCDQEHMRICILNNSIIPDRTNCILNNGENPLPYLNDSIRDLENINAKYFIVPCNTAHYFSNKFENTKIEFISMIEETLTIVRDNYKNNKICILGTTGTINSKVYHDHNLSKDLDFIFLDNYNQSTIMNVINDTKSDKDRNYIKSNLLSVVNNIKSKFDNVLFVLACTELSLYLEDVKKEALVIDAMDCLVNSTIVKCGYKLKENIQEII